MIDNTWIKDNFWYAMDDYGSIEKVDPDLRVVHYEPPPDYDGIEDPIWDRLHERLEMDKQERIEKLESENTKQRKQISKLFVVVENWKANYSSIDTQLNIALHELEELKAKAS